MSDSPHSRQCIIGHNKENAMPDLPLLPSCAGKKTVTVWVDPSSGARHEFVSWQAFSITSVVKSLVDQLLGGFGGRRMLRSAPAAPQA